MRNGHGWDVTSLKNYGTVNNKKPSGSDSQWVQFSAVHPQNDNNLIIVRRTPGYFLFLWYVVLLRRDDHDNQSNPGPAVPILRER